MGSYSAFPKRLPDMPDMHGFEVLFDFIPNRKLPQVAVVVLTRLSYSDLHNIVLHNGAQACLVKARTSATEIIGLAGPGAM